jgi:hypothetical protein
MKQFEKIAEDTIRKAEAVECPLAEFAKGLQEIIQTLTERWELAREEVAARVHRED